MSSVLGPGAHGEPLPAGAPVVRVAVLPKDYVATKIINPEVFALSSEDKASSLQALSVWHTELTTVKQACGFMAPKQEQYRLALYLKVDDIRQARPISDSPHGPQLEVVWDLLTVKQGVTTIPDPRAEAAGHAGVLGLLRSPGVDNCCTSDCVYG